METKELALLEDNKLEYTNTKKSTTNNELTLYDQLLKTSEFGREPTKGIVIDEDTYLSHLEKIIVRDYYPFLNKDKNNEDKTKINDLNQSIMSPLAGLKNINQEYEDTLGKEAKAQNSKEYNLNNIDLDTYLANFNSDELESFKDVMFKDKKKRLRQLMWIYEQSNYHNNKMFALQEYTDEFMKLPSAEGNKCFESGNLNSALSDPKNHFMFYAAGNYIHKSLEEDKSRFSENVLADKAILKENTRLPENFVEVMMQKTAFNMRKTLFENYENSDHAKIIKEANRIDKECQKDKNQMLGGSTPMVNGYKFVKEPIPEPGVIDQNPIMTWGEIASTPMVLRVNNDNKFTIQQTSQREKVAHTLTNMHNKQNEMKNKKQLSVKTIKTNSKIYEFTPNALKLLNSVNRKSSNIFDEPSSVYSTFN